MIPREYNFDATEVVIIDKQIEKFLQTGLIETTTHCEGKYISNIFIRPKKDGSYRLILNLKNLNQFVQYHHFKMENLKSAITLMSPNCYMASIDLKDAYYSVSIDTNHRKYPASLREVPVVSVYLYRSFSRDVISFPVAILVYHFRLRNTSVIGHNYHSH